MNNDTKFMLGGLLVTVLLELGFVVLLVILIKIASMGIALTGIEWGGTIFWPMIVTLYLIAKGLGYAVLVNIKKYVMKKYMGYGYRHLVVYPRTIYTALIIVELLYIQSFFVTSFRFFLG